VIIFVSNLRQPLRSHSRYALIQLVYSREQKKSVFTFRRPKLYYISHEHAARTSHSTQSPSIRRAIRWNLPTETTAVDFENHTKHVNAVWGKECNF